MVNAIDADFRLSESLEVVHIGLDWEFDYSQIMNSSDGKWETMREKSECYQVPHKLAHHPILQCFFLGGGGAFCNFDRKDFAH